MLKFQPLYRVLFPKKCLRVQCNFSSDIKDFDANKQPSSTKSRFKIFQDEDSPVILDVNEEKRLFQSRKAIDIPIDETPVVYQRGITGVFDIEDLVNSLKSDNAQDIFVLTVPKELNYVDYMVIVTGRSKRHLLGLAEYIRVLYKKKRNENDIIPIIEGENSKEWIALDLGNIALHIMSRDAREKYDLESLWSVGAEYDSKLQVEENSLLQLLKKHAIVLDDIQPLKGG